jgi:ABC-type dipeptide/oligopeptide/nickel transport system permease subunit
MLTSRITEIVMCVPTLVLILAVIAIDREADDLAHHGDHRRDRLDGHRPPHPR